VKHFRTPKKFLNGNVMFFFVKTSTITNNAQSADQLIFALACVHGSVPLA
jgi:hypothetical protein